MREKSGFSFSTRKSKKLLFLKKRTFDVASDGHSDSSSCKDWASDGDLHFLFVLFQRAKKKRAEFDERQRSDKF